MMSKTVLGVAFAAGCALAFGAMTPAGAQVSTQILTNGPQTSTGDQGSWSASGNNAESAQYERTLQTSPGFRQSRMQQECGPITDPQLREQCMASFAGASSPKDGSSMPSSQGR